MGKLSKVERVAPLRDQVAEGLLQALRSGRFLPGERLTERAQPMIDYLKMFETCFNIFPGFDVEIQGVYREVDASGRIRLHTYVVSE